MRSTEHYATKGRGRPQAASDSCSAIKSVMKERQPFAFAKHRDIVGDWSESLQFAT